MYNENIKYEYIKLPTHDNKDKEMLSFLFSKSAELEDKLSKDIYEFDKQDIQKLLESFGSQRREYLELTCLYFRAYYNWYWIDCIGADVSGTKNPFHKDEIMPIIQRLYLRKI